MVVGGSALLTNQDLCVSMHSMQQLRFFCTTAGHAGFGALSLGFLPHKLAYAALLADYGRVGDAVRYCSAVQTAMAALPKLPPGLLVAAAHAKDLSARLDAHAAVRLTVLLSLPLPPLEGRLSMHYLDNPWGVQLPSTWFQ